MQRRLTPFMGALLVLALAAPPAAQASAPRPHAVAPPTPRVIATFPADGEFGSFAESLAVARDGSLYASVTVWKDATSNVGKLYRISPNGRMHQIGPDLRVGILSGLAFGPDGYLYAGEIAFGPLDEPAGVLRFGLDGSVSRVVNLPEGTFPNGLAFRGGDLYIADSWSGAIWRAHPRAGHVETLATPWLQDPSLGVVTEGGWEGVNGIAFRGSTLYAVNADAGTVVRIPLQRNGSAGTPTVFVQASGELVGADGVAFDTAGGLWVAVNHGDEPAGGALIRVDSTGHLTVVASDPGWLDYPVQPVFGRGAAGPWLYVLNGSLNPGTPNLIALKVVVRGAQLP